MRILRAVVLLAGLFVGACGGSSSAPVSPTPSSTPAPPPTPTTVTLTGHLTATNGGQPLANVTASFGPAITATTNATGTFSMRFSPGTVSRLSLTGDAILPRSLVVAVSATRDLAVMPLPRLALISRTTARSRETASISPTTCRSFATGRRRR